MTYEECLSALFDRLRGSSRVLIVREGDDGIAVEDFTAESVMPCSVYPTKREAAARFMQLLQIGPVRPQTWPETACIGEVEVEP